MNSKIIMIISIIIMLLVLAICSFSIIYNNYSILFYGLIIGGLLLFILSIIDRKIYNHDRKEKRDEVWKRNKQYMETEDEKKVTACDLLPLCMKCSKFKNLKTHDFNKCRGEACMELWLSNEYLEWFSSFK